MIEKIRKVVESLGYPFFFGTRDEVYAYINRVRTCVAVYRQGNATGASQSLVFKFKGDNPQKMYYDVFAELKKVLTIGVQRTFFYDDVLEVRCPVMNRVFIGGGGRPTPPPQHIDYFSLTANDGDTSFRITSALIESPSIEYSYDGVTFTGFIFSQSGGTFFSETISIQNGQTIFLRGNNTTLGTSTSEVSKIDVISQNPLTVGGNIITLLDGIGQLDVLPDYAFSSLLYSNKIKGELLLPAKQIGKYSYYMIALGSKLSSVTILAENNAESCFNLAFRNCSELIFVEVHSSEWNTNNAQYWLDSVQATGIFRKPSGTTIPTGFGGIPSGWTVENF